MKKSIRYNKSKTYLLPLLSEFVQFDFKYYYLLENSYIYDNLSKYNNCIYLLHKVKIQDPEFTKYEHKLLNNNLFTGLVDLDKDYSVYVFKFPEDYMFEYKLFEQGKYSEFGEDSKSLILKFWTELHQNNINAVNFLVKLKQILFRDDKLRRSLEQELKVKLPETAELTDKIKVDHETIYLEPDNKLISSV